MKLTRAIKLKPSIVFNPEKKARAEQFAAQETGLVSVWRPLSDQDVQTLQEKVNNLTQTNTLPPAINEFLTQYLTEATKRNLPIHPEFARLINRIEKQQAKH